MCVLPFSRCEKNHDIRSAINLTLPAGDPARISPGIGYLFTCNCCEKNRITGLAGSEKNQSVRLSLVHNRQV